MIYGIFSELLLVLSRLPENLFWIPVPLALWGLWHWRTTLFKIPMLYWLLAVLLFAGSRIVYFGCRGAHTDRYYLALYALLLVPAACGLENLAEWLSHTKFLKRYSCKKEAILIFLLILCSVIFLFKDLRRPNVQYYHAFSKIILSQGERKSVVFSTLSSASRVAALSGARWQTAERLRVALALLKIMEQYENEPSPATLYWVTDLPLAAWQQAYPQLSNWKQEAVHSGKYLLSYIGAERLAPQKWRPIRSLAPADFEKTPDGWLSPPMPIHKSELFRISGISDGKDAIDVKLTLTLLNSMGNPIPSIFSVPIPGAKITLLKDAPAGSSTLRTTRITEQDLRIQLVPELGQRDNILGIKGRISHDWGDELKLYRPLNNALGAGTNILLFWDSRSSLELNTYVSSKDRFYSDAFSQEGKIASIPIPSGATSYRIHIRSKTPISSWKYFAIEVLNQKPVVLNE